MAAPIEDTATTTSAPARREGPRRPSGVGPVLLTTLTWIVAIGFFFPVLWMVLTAFKSENAAYTDPPTLFFSPTLEQFRAVFDAGIGPYLANSLGATAISTILVLVLATPRRSRSRCVRWRRP